MKRAVVLLFLGVAGLLRAGDRDVALHAAEGERVTTLIHVSPEGGGNRSGESLRDALPFGFIQGEMRRQEGDLKLLLGPGEYRLDQPIIVPRREGRTILRGADERTVLVGSYSPGEARRGHAAFLLRGDRVEIEAMSFRSLGSCVSTSRNIGVRHVRLRQLRAREMYSCVVVGRQQQAAVEDWLIEDLQVIGYYKVGIRLSGSQTSDIRMSSILLDGKNREQRNDCHKGGIQLLDGVSAIRIEDAVIRNNVGDCGLRYQQGDSIEIDHKGGTPHGIRIKNVRVETSGDAAFDLKGRDVTLEDVEVLPGPAQKYAFRFWKYGDYRCTRCKSAGAKMAHVGLVNATVSFRQSQFVDGATEGRLCLISDYASGAESRVDFIDSRRDGTPIAFAEPLCQARYRPSE